MGAGVLPSDGDGLGLGRWVGREDLRTGVVERPRVVAGHAMHQDHPGDDDGEHGQSPAAAGAATGGNRWNARPIEASRQIPSRTITSSVQSANDGAIIWAANVSMPPGICSEEEEDQQDRRGGEDRGRPAGHRRSTARPRGRGTRERRPLLVGAQRSGGGSVGKAARV